MIRNLLILILFISGSRLHAQDYSVVNAFPNLSFNNPVGIYHGGDNTDRLFVLEQAGTIKVFNNDPNITNQFIN